MSYPENLPSQEKLSINNFNFSFSMAAKAKNELQEHYDSLSERIESIVESEKFFISGFSVLKQILILNPTKSDLKKLSKALDRLADLIHNHDQIQSKLNLFKTVTDDPQWFVWTCGDFSNEVDQDLTSFFKELED